MKKRPSENFRIHEPLRGVGERWLWRISVLGVVLIPLLISPRGNDTFRLPKELLFRAEGITLLAIALSTILLRGLPDSLRGRQFYPIWVISTAALGWTSLTLLASSNRTLSAFSLLWLICSISIFVATAWNASHRSLHVIAWVLIPAIPNVVVVFLQVLKIGEPLEIATTLGGRFSATGLLGNPNDVGTYLVIPTLAAAGAGVVWRSFRWLYLGVGALLFAALIASQTLTAILAVIAGILALSFLASLRQTVWVASILALGVVIVVAVHEPLKTRTRDIGRWLAQGNYDKILSSRMVSFAAAAEMFRGHPFLGVGPGCYGFQFFPQKIAVQEKYAELLNSRDPFTRLSINFGEAHNDHLEILAETGLPGYLIFLAALLSLGRISFPRKGSADFSLRRPQERFAHLLSFPLALALFVLALAQFPLQLAAPTSALLFVSALCAAWSKS